MLPLETVESVAPLVLLVLALCPGQGPVRVPVYLLPGAGTSACTSVPAAGQ